MNNNGVNDNQGVASAQPVLTPVTNSSAGVSTSGVSTQPVSISAATVSGTQSVTTSSTITNNTAISTGVAPAASSLQPPIVPPTSGGGNQNPAVESSDANKTKSKKNKVNFTVIFLIIILILVGYIIYSNRNYSSIISRLKYNCTPVSSYKEEKELDIESSLVQGLYKKVHTSIREDIAQPEWNDNMKLYLAYRQVLETDKYDSNCNMFDSSKMEPYTCEISTEFIPKAFRKDVLVIEWKKLFGEETEITLNNIKLQNDCIGGYEYIPEREEYVQGYCKQQSATSFKAVKTLTKAVTYRNTIIIDEEVKYQSNEKMELPSYLKNGTYQYTFRLDMNYNYVLVSRVYIDKYS